MFGFNKGAFTTVKFCGINDLFRIPCCWFYLIFQREYFLNVLGISSGMVDPKKFGFHLHIAQSTIIPAGSVSDHSLAMVHTAEVQFRNCKATIVTLWYIKAQFVLKATISPGIVHEANLLRRL